MYHELVCFEATQGAFGQDVPVASAGLQVHGCGQLSLTCQALLETPE